MEYLLCSSLLNHFEKGVKVINVDGFTLVKRIKTDLYFTSQPYTIPFLCRFKCLKRGKHSLVGIAMETVVDLLLKERNEFGIDF